MRSIAKPRPADEAPEVARRRGREQQLFARERDVGAQDREQRTEAVGVVVVVEHDRDVLQERALFCVAAARER